MTEPDNRINSRESFIIVRELGVDGVELDVRLSPDGELLVIHDPAYEDGRAVSETPSKDRPANVIKLAQALDLCAGLIVNIEIKNYPSDPAFDASERIADRVAELLDFREGRDRVLISCFGVDSLDRLRALQPTLETAHLVLSRRPAKEVVKTCVDHGHGVIHPYASMIDDEFMQIARAHDLKVNVWTGFDETDESLTKLMAHEIDGVITGYPTRALRCRG